ncbi:MAG TPA: hypothetical protein VKV17_12090 [Bryobacteraceae bacterium]|nr:hypothetical protein [Bryobacteraceae bacterium]
MNTANTPTLRSEGVTEEVGDIVITCTGGQVLSNLGNGGTSNPLAPATNITVSLPYTVTSRLLGSGVTAGVSEALLLIDEPTLGNGPVPGYGSNAPFQACAVPGATQGGCAGPTAGTLPGSSTYVLSQSGAGGQLYQTAVTGAPTTGNVSTSTTTIGPAPNVYQGVVSGNQVTFYGVPVVPPGTNSTRVFRITNVRINASTAGSSTSAVPVQASILITNPTALPLSTPTPIVGFIRQSLAKGGAGIPVGAFSQCVSVVGRQANTITFTELFAGAFKTRVDATVAGQSSTSATYLQNKPGNIYNSESGFTLSGIPGLVTSSSGLGPGLADSGTRLTAVFNNLPAGISHIYVSASNNTGTGLAPANTAVAITGETVADGSTGVPTATPITVLGIPVPVVEITPAAGATTTTATWEIVASQPTQLQSVQFTVYISYTSAPATNSPAAGTATVNLRYGPLDTSGGTATSGPIPRFTDTSTAQNLFNISICQTVLLFPFVTNQAGFDTGIAIANTSTDPFGTAPQTGTCSMNWYGSGAPSAATTTPSIASASDYATLTSVVAPGFQGYMIAVCNFQYAHGFAFVDTAGLNGVAVGYLALVIPEPSLNTSPIGVTPYRPANNATMSPAGSGEQLSQ